MFLVVTDFFFKKKKTKNVFQNPISIIQQNVVIPKKEAIAMVSDLTTNCKSQNTFNILTATS